MLSIICYTETNMTGPTMPQGGETDIAELVRIIFARAVDARASDVHIEPTGKVIRIRFRIDGTLRDQGNLPIKDHEKIVTRLKVLSDLDIAARPTPQDGHFELDISDLSLKKEPNITLQPIEQRMLDVRLSIFPTVHGDAAVCRLLNRAEALFPIEKLGLDDASLAAVNELIVRSYGMVLVTGPTGSGKTTTLYSMLERSVGQEKNIITLEDPVEFRFEQIRQVQMQPDRGMTFSVGMKAVLRQDPDMIMIGEIRDPETAEHAVRAALIGRTVFSTIHSNTTVGTIARLIDMGVERTLIAYALNGVIATRLVKKNCEYCRVQYSPSDEYQKYFNIPLGDTKLMKGAGCEHCEGRGYSGRTGVFEVLLIDTTLRAMIIDKASMAELESHAREAGLKTLKEDALDKVLRGITTVESVASVI
jgi:type II secretory ATPase GspE/PulE/Tfp pilus assembly ATPase PilB-like protein